MNIQLQKRKTDNETYPLSNFRMLPQGFFLQDTITVAKKLLGKYIIKKENSRFLIGKITETEAYLGTDDPACHSYRKITQRNSVMFEEGGISYVYFIYGNYHCFNVVTETKGTGSAVLIRAVEPVSGIKIMQKRRQNLKSRFNLTNGPAKFCISFGIDRRHNGLNLNNSIITIAESVNPEKIRAVVTKRIGIKEGADFPYRFFIKDNIYVSVHRINKEIISEINV